VPDKFGASLRAAAKADLKVLFKELDADHSGYLDEEEIGQAAAKLGFPFKTKAELQAEFKLLDENGDGKISEREFINWWNAQDSKSGLWQKLHGELNAAGDWEG